MDDNELLQPNMTGYEVEDKSEFFDTKEGKVLSKEELKNLPEIDIMKSSAQTIGVTLKDPKKDCRKCYGRGFIGKDAKTGQPIACTCVFDKKDLKESGDGGYMNHAAKRYMKLNIRRKVRKMNSKQLRKIVDDEQKLIDSKKDETKETVNE
jgi:hypothetical protein